MPLQTDDIVPLSQARARLTELAEAVQGGGQKLITRNGESYAVLIGPQTYDRYCRLEREHLHLLLLEEAERGLDDVDAGRVHEAAEVARRFGR